MQKDTNTLAIIAAILYAGWAASGNVRPRADGCVKTAAEIMEQAQKFIEQGPAADKT